MKFDGKVGEEGGRRRDGEIKEMKNENSCKKKWRESPSIENCHGIKSRERKRKQDEQAKQDHDGKKEGLD